MCECDEAVRDFWYPLSSWADEDDGGGGHLALIPGGAGVGDKQTRQSLHQSNWVNKAARWRDGFGNPCTQPYPTGAAFQDS